MGMKQEEEQDQVTLQEYIDKSEVQGRMRGERRIVLKMFVLLYNMRARMIGINQIRTTYMPHLERDANENIRF